MRRILIFMFLAFSIVCFASPPPVPDVVAENFQFVPPDEIQSIQTIDVQEVAFVYLGNFEMAGNQAEYFEPVQKLIIPVAKITDVNYFRMNEQNKPPAVTRDLQVLNFNPDKQHSNYNYPLPANSVFS
jgi:hypothetical protein